jgi:DNA-binding transcriptional ArsR family regulator
MEELKQGEFDEHLDDGTCRLVAEFFSVYSNQTRVNILCALRNGPKTVSELAEHANVSLQNISQHLRVMRDRGAVQSEKRGQHVYYSVANIKFLYGIKMIRDALLEELQLRANDIASPSASNE